MLFGLKGVGCDGIPPGLGRAALREILGKFISGFILLLGYFWVGWDRRKQRWHDKLAYTFVVKVDRI